MAVDATSRETVKPSISGKHLLSDVAVGWLRYCSRPSERITAELPPGNKQLATTITTNTELLDRTHLVLVHLFSIQLLVTLLYHFLFAILLTFIFFI